jgi:eukaryotic-like serine/threonine-protein kinase
VPDIPNTTPGSDGLAPQSSGPSETARMPDSAYGHVDLSFLDPPTCAEDMGTMGKYRIQSIVGTGGMGIVFRAFEVPLNRTVAIKVPPPFLAASSHFRQRFMSEARLAAAVSHQNVITIHAVDEHRGTPFLVMEYVDGETLKDKIQRKHPLPLEDILHISTQIAAGLAAAQSQGLIHRDIKPANILLDNGIERVRIADFGLARAALDNSGMSSTGNFVGTPAYMSPEQVRGEQVDFRTDLFSLGCVMYCMVTGRSPFSGRDGIAIARRVVDFTPPSLSTLAPQLPKTLSNVVDRLLAKNPDDRFQSASEIHTYLLGLRRDLTEEITTPFPFVSHPIQRSKNRSIQALILLLVTLSGLTLVQFWNALVGLGQPAQPVAALSGNQPVQNGVPPVGRTLRVGLESGADFSDLHLALSAVSPGETIEITDSREYSGPFEVLRPLGATITIRGASGQTPTLVAPPGTPVLKIAGAPGVVVESLRIRSQGLQTAIELSGALPGVTLRNLHVTALGDDGVPLISIEPGCGGSAEAPLWIDRSLLECQDGQSIWCEGSPRRPVRHLRVSNSVFRSDHAGSLLVFWQGAEHVEIDHNLFVKGAIGINFNFPTDHFGRKIQVHHNTFFRNPWWIGVVSTEISACEDITLSDNLLVETGGIQAIDRFRGTLPAPQWSITGNVWEPRSDSPPEPYARECLEKLVRLTEALPLASRDEANPQFLRPLESIRPEPTTSGKSDETIGAFPPIDQVR